LQLRATPLDGLEELAEIILQVREHLVGVIFGAERISRSRRRASSMISALRFSARLRTSSSEVIFSASSWALRMMRSLSLRASSSIAWRSLTIQRACLSSSGWSDASGL
jgi:hypothetical protein